MSARSANAWRRNNRERARELQRAASSRWRKKNPGRRNKWNGTTRTRGLVAKLKIGRPCADCGGVFPPVCMDFDHRPGEVKLRNVSSSLSLGQALEEIAKCDLVCANCHRLRTHQRHLDAKDNMSIKSTQLTLEGISGS